jgi:hypothetical protein
MLTVASWIAMSHVRGSLGSIPAMNCSHTVPGISISARQIVKHLSGGFEDEEITPLRRFACGGGMVCRSEYWQPTMASVSEGRPELLQGTVTDITSQKKAQTRLRDIKAVESTLRMPAGENARVADLSQRIGNILRRVSKSLQPDNLSQIDRAEMQECLLALEQMKMLMSELEILHLLRE